MKIETCAKINLGLNIVRKRADGYHDLETVFYPVKIHDEIEIEQKNSQAEACTLCIQGHKIEGNPQDNLIVKAYLLLAEKYNIPPIHVTLDKQIPMQAGMGGGSADCGYTIRLLNDMFHLGLSIEEMQRHAAKLGADCAFFITAQPSYAEGIGDILTPVDLNLNDYYIAIVKPPIAISTKEAFAGIHAKAPKKNCKEIIKLPIEQWKNLLVNDFEESILPQHPIIGQIKQSLYDEGALYAAMSGSGSALFGIFKNAPHAISELFPDCYTKIVKG